MIRFFKKYYPFAKAGFLNFLAYKFVVFCWLIVSILSTIVTFFVWTAVFKSYAESSGMLINDVILNGFHYKEMISYSVIIFIASFCTMNDETMDRMSDEIKDGSIAMQLIKPISYRIRFIFASIGNLVSINLIMGIPLVAIGYTTLMLLGFIEYVSVLDIVIRVLCFFLAELVACLLIDGFNYIFGLFTFYTMASFGLFNVKNVIQNFLAGTLIPISFFANSNIGWIRGFGRIFEFSPFVFMAQFPTYILINRISYIEIAQSFGIALIWIFAFELIGGLLYHHAIKNVVIQGG